tara:strand:- start:690 stop:1064 length:375 start_codon:yes stop_codon:yes gene_type:complete
MELIKKIDHKLFWPVSLIVTLAFCFLAQGRIEILVIIGVYTATLISLFLLMYIMHVIIFDQQALKERKVDKVKLFLYMMLHILFLFGSIGLGVHFMGNRIIIPVLNYVAQIFVLAFGLRKNLKS